MIDIEKYRLKELKYFLNDCVAININLSARENMNVFMFNDEELKKIKDILKEYNNKKEQ